MGWMEVVDMLLKLVVSVILGALIGLDRETHGRPAGLRTHILVCLGSTLFTLCSYKIGGENGRIAAQIVTGIGFLGAGTIMRQGSMIKGLTSAASIWTVAAIGISVAIGGWMMLVAACASLIAFAVLKLMPVVEMRLGSKTSERVIVLELDEGKTPISEVFSALEKSCVKVGQVSTEAGSESFTRVFRLQLLWRPDISENEVLADVVALPGVSRCTREF